MNVTILHGYSAANSGDCLPVDGAVDTVLRNFGINALTKLVASDCRPSKCVESAFEHFFLLHENIIKGVLR